MTSGGKLCEKKAKVGHMNVWLNSHEVEYYTKDQLNIPVGALSLRILYIRHKL